MDELMKKLNQGWVKLAALLNPKVRAEKQLLEALQRDYFEEQQIAEVLKKESERIPYSHLCRELLEIAGREQQHAEMLAAKIRDLNGEISDRAANLQQARKSETFSSTLDLLKLLQEEKDEYIEYLESAHLAKEAGRTKVATLLRQIAEDEKQHREQLTEIVTKLNPLPASEA